MIQIFTCLYSFLFIFFCLYIIILPVIVFSPSVAPHPFLIHPFTHIYSFHIFIHLFVQPPSVLTRSYSSCIPHLSINSYFLFYLHHIFYSFIYLLIYHCLFTYFTSFSFFFIFVNLSQPFYTPFCYLLPFLHSIIKENSILNAWIVFCSLAF